MADLSDSRTDLALQLFSVHKELNTDPHKTLDWVAGAGFKAVEVAGFGHLGAQGFAAELQNHQLSCIGIHGPCVEAYGEEYLSKLVDWCKRMRDLFLCDTVVVFRDPESFADEQSKPDSERKYYTDLASSMDRFAKLMQEAHIKVAFHCYHVDLMPFREQSTNQQRCGLQVLLDMVGLVNFSLQLDTYFLIKASRVSRAPSVSLATMAEGRVSSVHVNDIYDDGRSAPMGEGTGKLSEILPPINEANEDLRWILELDPTLGDAQSRKLSIIQSQGYWQLNAPSWLSTRKET